MPRFLTSAAVLASLVGLSAATALAQNSVTPAWMKVDTANKTIAMDVIAGFNASNNSWNFNGYYAGDATVVVPVGWQVNIFFSNHDGEVPHSLVVMNDPHDENELPMQADRNDSAFKRAYSKSPVDGIGDQDSDTVTFTADKAGDYMWFCGVPGHGVTGMWVKFHVVDSGEPHLEVASGADPGRE